MLAQSTNGPLGTPELPSGMLPSAELVSLYCQSLKNSDVPPNSIPGIQPTCLYAQHRSQQLPTLV